MNSRKWLSLVLLGLGASAAIVACKVNLPDDGKYRCDTDTDCGNNFTCVHPADSLPYCCELGSACAPGTGGGTGGGGGGGTEVCNGVDDDGDGQIDEGFNLQTDRENCGLCGRACTALENCTAGNCVAKGETNCADTVDNDNDQKTDCADPDCNAVSCGTGCVCLGGGKHESTCFLGNDEDGDGLIDCLDPDCALQSCGQGCACETDGGKAETSCTDGLDNDQDGDKDCLDTVDCVDGANCKPNPNTSTCAAGVCSCNGGPAPSGELQLDGGVACNDGIDNDCSGAIDCADISCANQNCATDGGVNTCRCRNLQPSENNCANKGDDDGDNLIDCEDSLPDGGGDCPIGIQCRKPNNQLGTCRATKACN